MVDVRDHPLHGGFIELVASDKYRADPAVLALSLLLRYRQSAQSRLIKTVLIYSVFNRPI
jgi:hypothetical protein